MSYSVSGVINSYLDKGPPVDVRAIADDLGVPVEVRPLSEQISGKIARDSSSRSGFRIVINALDGARRQRFTLAHEIAHYVLHRDLIPSEGVVDNAMYRSAQLSDAYERQADIYAANLLLPSWMVKSAYKSEKSLAGLTRQFDVSERAIRIRLKELGLGV